MDILVWGGLGNSDYLEKNDVVFQYIFVLLAEKKTRYIPCLYLVFFYMYFKWTEVL